MRCPRCDKKIKRKIWKQNHFCHKCKFAGVFYKDPTDKFLYSFLTNKYIVYVDKNGSTYVWFKKSNQMIFDYQYSKCPPDYNYRYDIGKYVYTLNKKLSKKATDEDIDKFLMLR